MWKLLDFCRVKNESNVYSLQMAQQWYMANGKPFSSAVDKAMEKKSSRSTSDRQDKKRSASRSR